MHVGPELRRRLLHPGFLPAKSRGQDEKTKEGARPLVAGQRKCERGRESTEAQGASERGEVNELGSLHGRYFRASVPRRQLRRARPDAAWLGATSKVVYSK